MPRLVSEAEAAYLLLVARRQHNAKVKAKTVGLEFHPTIKYTQLSCGFLAYITIKETSTGVTPILILKTEIPLDVDPNVVAKDVLGENVTILKSEIYADGYFWEYTIKS